MFAYWRFVEKFHVRPESLRDLVEFSAYLRTTEKLDQYQMALSEMARAAGGAQ